MEKTEKWNVHCIALSPISLHSGLLPGVDSSVQSSSRLTSSFWPVAGRTDWLSFVQSFQDFKRGIPRLRCKDQQNCGRNNC